MKKKYRFFCPFTGEAPLKHPKRNKIGTKRKLGRTCVCEVLIFVCIKFLVVSYVCYIMVFARFKLSCIT